MAKTMTVEEVTLTMAKMLLTAEGNRSMAILICEKVINTYEQKITENLAISEVQANQAHINHWNRVIAKIKILVPSKSDKL